MSKIPAIPESEPQELEVDLKSVGSRAEEEPTGVDEPCDDYGNPKVITKYDADVASVITFDTSLTGLNHNPSSLFTANSSKLEVQLTFLAKELELERKRREQLQVKVDQMAEILKRQQKQATYDIEKTKLEMTLRRTNMKPPDMDLEKWDVQGRGGFVSI